MSTVSPLLIRLLPLLLLFFALKLSGSTGADEPPFIDLVRVDAATGQLTLCVVQQERIDNRAAADRLRRKLHAYARYARSEQVFKDHRYANRSLLPALSVIVFNPVPNLERENLAGIKLQYRYTDLSIGVEAVEPGSVRPDRH